MVGPSFRLAFVCPVSWLITFLAYGAFLILSHALVGTLAKVSHGCRAPAQEVGRHGTSGKMVAAAGCFLLLLRELSSKLGIAVPVLGGAS